MKTPRSISSKELIATLLVHGYIQTRQTGSHIRLTRNGNNGQQHITIPNHNPIKIGTLNNILNDVAEHLNIPKDQILKK